MNVICIHFGPPTGKIVPCQTCRNTKLKTFACTVHGECTPIKRAADTACCKTCPDRDPGTQKPSVA